MYPPKFIKTGVVDGVKARPREENFHHEKHSNLPCDYWDRRTRYAVGDRHTRHCTGLALELPAAADGLFRGRRLRLHGHHRGLLRQGEAWAHTRFAREPRLLGGPALGDEDAAGSSGGRFLALEGAVRLPGGRADGCKSRDHGRPDRACRLDGNIPAPGRLVRDLGAARPHRVCAPGRGGRCNDRRGRARPPGG